MQSLLCCNPLFVNVTIVDHLPKRGVRSSHFGKGRPDVYLQILALDESSVSLENLGVALGGMDNVLGLLFPAELSSPRVPLGENHSDYCSICQGVTGTPLPRLCGTPMSLLHSKLDVLESHEGPHPS